MMLKIIIHRGILISILKEKKIKYNNKKSVLTIMALYPKITNVFSNHGKGKTWLLSPWRCLPFSINQNITAAKKQALQKTVIFEKKRIRKELIVWC